MEHLTQRSVVCESDIRKSLVEAINCTTIHFLVLSVTAMHLDDCRLVAIELGVRAGTAERPNRPHPVIRRLSLIFPIPTVRAAAFRQRNPKTLRLTVS